MGAMTRAELARKVKEIGPWHYCHIFPGGISTGSCKKESVHPKLQRLLKHGAFSKSKYPRVLDLGANSGIISMWFCDHKGSKVAAYETGKKFYPQLELAVQIKGYSNKITPIQESVRFADFGEGCFDLVLFLGLMHHIPVKSRRPTLDACYRALVEEGEIVVQTKLGTPVQSVLRAAGFEAVRKLYTYTETSGTVRVAWEATKRTLIPF